VRVPGNERANGFNLAHALAEFPSLPVRSFARRDALRFCVSRASVSDGFYSRRAVSLSTCPREQNRHSSRGFPYERGNAVSSSGQSDVEADTLTSASVLAHAALKRVLCDVNITPELNPHRIAQRRGLAFFLLLHFTRRTNALFAHYISHLPLSIVTSLHASSVTRSCILVLDSALLRSLISRRSLRHAHETKIHSICSPEKNRG